MFNTTCNSTLDDLRINRGDEKEILGPLTFHELARIIGAATTLIATVLSLYLIWMHALHYTRPREQRQIIRILFMVPVYAISSFLQIQWYWHAIYFQVMSDCYEAFAIASFFSLMCHYIAPDLHSQKEFFRNMRPIKGWIWPVSWMKMCCLGEKGPWRTPKSGLTWFNIVWIGIYHYCFIRVAMTIVSVVSQYFNKYCEISNSPVFAHVWVLVINSVAVFIAMLCVIQFYYQLREDLAEHKPFTKVIAIKLVVFLGFWQTTCISLGTSTFSIIHANKALAWPDLRVGIPALLLCIEMSCFSILHLWAFPYAPYRVGAKPTYYPVPDRTKGEPYIENVSIAPAGGFLGLSAIWDAMNLWDFVKAFGRGMRWLLCGLKRRKEDVSYKNTLDMDNLHQGKDGSTYDALRAGAKSTDHLPIASEFRRSTFGINSGYDRTQPGEESAGLIENAQPNPEAGMAIGAALTTNSPPRRTSPYRPGQQQQQQSLPTSRDPSPYEDMPHGRVPMGAYDAYEPPQSTTPYPDDAPRRPQNLQVQPPPPSQQQSQIQSPASPQRPPPPQQHDPYGGNPDAQARMGEALWGQKFI